MKIVSLVVENFRAINRVELSGLQDMIVIAGPNGCGKSCVLDSIRLFKSVYGGYQPNEWHQWFGEFQIDFQRNPQQMASLLRHRSQPSVIRAGIALAYEEISFIKEEIKPMLEELAWKTVVPGLLDYSIRSQATLAAQFRAHQPEVDRRVREYLPVVEDQLQRPVQYGQLAIYPDGRASVDRNILLELIFSSVHPKRIGVIDYHGSHRNYNRERLGGINLNLDQEERVRSTSLYNYANKYANIKSEMAAGYVRQTLMEKHLGKPDQTAQTEPLSETLQELFKIFFPGKKFLGPVPTENGGLDFPVEVGEGATHDINELSSGEKEVLFGYLRLRNSAPKHSVILLDEPELHLNPALVRGLPQFYLKHLGLELENQIWLVTHSDAFLREAMGHDRLRVFHMQYSTAMGTVDNQIHEIQPGEEVEALILEMVGDLAAYRPGAKVVFFEGENSEFDLSMVSRLFPAIEKEMNLISGGNRSRVETLHKTLEQSVQAGSIPIKIYSVVDKDSGVKIGPSSGFPRHYSWDVYHIENYLLDARFISQVLHRVNVQNSSVSSIEKIEQCLSSIARDQIGELVGHKVRVEIGSELVQKLKLKSNPSSKDIGTDLHDSIVKSVQRVRDLADNDLRLSNVEERVEKERQVLENSLLTGNWKEHFKGRDILRAFAGKYLPGMRYEYFRDSIISEMATSGHQPEGMKAVFDQILND